MTNEHGYQSFELGNFGFSRDEYFCHISWETNDGRPMSHTMDAGNYLRALMRDVAWGFFYGWVNFDEVIGTVNHYSTVDFYAGSYNGAMKMAGVDQLENFPTDDIRQVFEAMLADWTNAGFDPFAAPQETGSPYGPKMATTWLPSPGPGSWRAAVLVSRATCLCVLTKGAPRSTGLLLTSPRTPPKSMQNPGMKTRSMPSTCLRSCPAPR